MRWMAISMLALSTCGGSSVEWAGKWRRPAGLPAGSYSDGSTERFNFGQPDHDHLTTQDPQRTVNLARQ